MLRDAQVLSCLAMLMACATLLAIVSGMMVILQGERLDWHPQRDLNFQLSSPFKDWFQLPNPVLIDIW